jgi:GDP-L-fucose synthase
MRVFLTGARGMLGQHIFAKLSFAGHLVMAPNSNELDLRDSGATFRFMNECEADVVIHCAAVVGGIKANIAGGGKFLTDNLEIDHSVIYSAQKFAVPNFVYL